MSFYQIAQNGRRAEIHLFGSITKYPWNRGDKSAAGLVDELKQLDADEIHLHIDSLGGSVPEAFGMYQTLLQHPAKVTTYADGFVASAALYPFLAGDERIATSTSAFYFHEAATYAEGYAEDLHKAAEQVALITDIGINAFVERTGQKREKIAQLMKDETWMTPDEALQMGLATSVMRPMSDKPYTQDAFDSLIQAARAAKQQAQPPVNNIKKFFALERSN